MKKRKCLKGNRSYMMANSTTITRFGFVGLDSLGGGGTRNTMYRGHAEVPKYRNPNGV